MSFIASVTDESVDLSSFIPVIKVIGVGGAGGNAIANIMSLEGVQCVIANTDAQSLVLSPCKNRIQLGRTLTAGLGAGALPEIGKKAALESKDEIMEFLKGTNMVFITAGMGGGTGTGAAPVIAQIAREMGILTVAVVTKPFNFEGHHRIELAEQGVQELEKHVDTIIVVANQKLFRVSNENTTFTDAFRMADEVLYGGVKCITDLITMPGLINLDFADIRTVMSNMGYAMMGSSEASGEGRANVAIEMAITNPLLENVSLEGAKGILVNITGGPDMTLFEVNDVVAKIQEKIDRSTRLIFGAIFDKNMEGKISVAVVATGVNSVDKKESQSAKMINNVKEETEKQVHNTVSHANKPPYMNNAQQQNNNHQHIQNSNSSFTKSTPNLINDIVEPKEAFDFYKDSEFNNYSDNIVSSSHNNQQFDAIEDEIITNAQCDVVIPAPVVSAKKNYEDYIKRDLDDNSFHYQDKIQKDEDIEDNNYKPVFVETKKDIIPMRPDISSNNDENDETEDSKVNIFSRMANFMKSQPSENNKGDQKKKLNDGFQASKIKESSNQSFFSIIENNDLKE